MAILSTKYYDADKLHSTIKALADAANTASPTGPAGPAGPAGAGPAGATGPAGPAGATGPGNSFTPPTTDPHVVGQVWNQAGRLVISAG